MASREKNYLINIVSRRKWYVKTITILVILANNLFFGSSSGIYTEDSENNRNIYENIKIKITKILGK